MFGVKQLISIPSAHIKIFDNIAYGLSEPWLLIPEFLNEAM
jgi:hypothetical protein